MKVAPVEGVKFKFDLRPELWVKWTRKWDVHVIKALLQKLADAKKALDEADRDVNIPADLQALRRFFQAALHLESILDREEMDDLLTEVRSLRILHHFKSVYESKVGGKQLSLTTAQVQEVAQLVHEYNAEFSEKIGPLIDKQADEMRRMSIGREMLKDIVQLLQLFPFRAFRARITALVGAHGQLKSDVGDLVTQIGRLVKSKRTDEQHGRDIQKIKDDFEKRLFPHLEKLVNSAMYIQKVVNKWRGKLVEIFDEVNREVDTMVKDGFPESKLKTGGDNSIMAMQSRLRSNIKRDIDEAYAGARYARDKARKTGYLDSPKRAA